VDADGESAIQVVDIIAHEPCWVDARADDVVRRDFYLYSGQNASVKFSQHLKLKLGNAGGVKLNYNGKPFPTDFESGDVKDLAFPPQGD